MSTKPTISSGIKASIFMLISYFGVPYLIFNFIAPETLGGAEIGNAQVFTSWFLNFGLIMAGIIFIREVSTRGSWRYHFADFLMSIVGLFFVIKILATSLELTMGDITFFMDFRGFFNLYLLAMLVALFGKFMKILESIGKEGT
ncbi:MAG: hypothetical protein J7L07_05440 [Candidatus Odinarchaeota archaeon]|nr:hypothetical protein [Candidatus Odinarchaeota archaeon]